jgi:hypothetical protein
MWIMLFTAAFAAAVALSVAAIIMQSTKAEDAAAR